MRRPDSRIRLAVTGVGIICSIGRSREEVWDSILARADGIRPLSCFPNETFPTTLAAEVEGSLDAASLTSRRESRRFSRSDLLAVVAASEALQHSQSSGTALDLQETIVSTGTSTGGLLEGEDYYFRRRVLGRRRTPASRVLQQPTSGPSDAVARLLGLGGGVFSNATACASGGAAIGLAADLIRSGHASVALAGGTDALCRLTYSGFNVLQAVDQGPCRPFDASRAGITLGEGAAYLVIEKWDDAIGRGAEILAELCGYGASCDAWHPTAPAEDGRGAAAAMTAALRESCMTADSIEYVNAHGTGTLLNDSAESKAILSTLGTSAVVSSTKSYFGHTLGASGGLEAVITVLALMHQVAPPTLRLDCTAEECSLDCVPNVPRPMPLNRALSNTFGFGGSNISLIFRRPGE